MVAGITSAAEPPPASLDVGASLVRGTAWMVAMRWSIRGLGLVNTFVLARLLSPGDFGLVAMAMLVVGLVEAAGQSGQLLALLRHPDPRRADYDSVWTLSIIVAALLTVLLWCVAPLASLYFHAPRVGQLVRVLALRTLLAGFENVGTVAFRKELDFAREYRFLVLQRLLSLVSTIGVAIVLRNYWALVLGILVGQVLTTALSFMVHPYRPRLAVSKIPELWSFSGWIGVVSLAQYLQDRADELVVGALTSASAMGSYNVASDLATAPTLEVVMPMTRALFPIIARIADDPVALRKGFLDVFSGTAILCCATAAGVALVAADFVAVALGPQWTQAVPLVQVLAFSGGLYGIMQGAVTLLGATGHARLSAMVSVSRALLTYPALIAAGLLGSVQDIALARTAVTLLLMPGVFLALTRVLPITMGDLTRLLWRPVCAAGVMAITLCLVQPAAAAAAWARLLIEVPLGAISFALAMVALWWLAGRPAGAEAGMLQRIRTVWRVPQWRAGRLRRDNRL